MPWLLRNKVYYAVFTAVFFLFWLLFKMGGMPDVAHALLSTTVDVTLSMLAMFVTVHILLPLFVYRNKYAAFTCCYIALVLVCGSIIIQSQLSLDGSSLSEYQANILKYPKHYFYWFWADLVFGSYFLVFFISSAGAAIRFAFDREQALKRAEQMEKEKISAELDLLKNQLNPHFLFNALNTIYYKIDRTNRPARETLQRFSSMLRYQLYECDKPFIAIERELECIAAYVDLQKERLNGNYSVDCSGFDTVKGLQISPFLLLPIVENCFKHLSNGLDMQNKIHITLTQNNNSFCLSTCNTVSNDDNNPEKGGIGLAAIRKRLQLVYPGKHILVINQPPGSFELTLNIETV